MKKSLNLIPFLLLGLYFLFIRTYDNISFLIKMIIISSIILISSFILYRNNQNNQIPKNRLFVFFGFVAVSFLIFLWFLYK